MFFKKLLKLHNFIHSERNLIVENAIKSMLLEIFEMPPYEEKVGNEALSMYNSVNLRVLSTIPTQLPSPLICKCGI